MKLSTIDRIIITKSLLPETGSIDDIKKKISIKNKIGFTEEEYEKFNITIPSVNMLQIDHITDDMLVRNLEYEISIDELTFLKKLAKLYSDNGWVMESSLDTIEMLLNYIIEE